MEYVHCIWALVAMIISSLAELSTLWGTMIYNPSWCHHVHTSQVSGLGRESHASKLNLTLSRLMVYTITPSIVVWVTTAYLVSVL